MKKKIALLCAFFVFFTSFLTVHAETVSYESAKRAFKLDTASYTMAPGDIYDFKVILKGDLTQNDVKVSDSRTGSVVKLSRISGTDKYRITARAEGTTYVVAEVGDAHLSFTVTVKNNIEQGGRATYSNYAIVPDTYVPVVPVVSSKPSVSSTPSSSAVSSAHKIYVTRTGKRYHYDPHCNGGTYYEATLEEARARGLTPCNKCC